MYIAYIIFLTLVYILATGIVISDFGAFLFGRNTNMHLVTCMILGYLNGWYSTGYVLGLDEKE